MVFLAVEFDNCSDLRVVIRSWSKLLFIICSVNNFFKLSILSLISLKTITNLIYRVYVNFNPAHTLPPLIVNDLDLGIYVVKINLDELNIMVNQLVFGTS